MSNPKFNLKKMLDEIHEDQAAESTKHRKLSQDGVKRYVARKRKERGRLNREQ
jgi:hypothetical protein